jgi:hypothetical protein
MYTVLLNQIIKIANLFNNSAKSEVGKHGFVVKFFLLYEKLILVGKVTVSVVFD